jgi:hypothetical protein
MTTLMPAAVLGLCMLGATAPAAAMAPGPPGGSWHFTVLLDGRRIGEHDFHVTGGADETDVDSEAHFKVKVAFISLYEYDHQDHEVWHNGCLERVTSRTRDAGRQFAVQGDLEGDAFRVRGSRGAATLPACVRTFAYWDPRLLTGPRLLNSQTGEYQPVMLTREGPEGVKVRGQLLAAQRYSLRAPKLEIDLWYTAAGDWVALESKLESGRTLRYEIQ